MDIIQLYQDYSVPYVTEGHKHTRPGWVNTECPFCTGNPGYHLGFELRGNYYYCWRCGWHPIVTTVAQLIHLKEGETRKLISKYGILVPKVVKEPIIAQGKEHRLPSGTYPLLPSHKKYLEKRGFDPDELERKWNLISTGPISTLDGIDYKHRIIIPFIWDQQQVSFDSRSIVFSKSDQQRYKACPKEREIIPHKSILYGKQEHWKDSIILVEGPTDVWRFGWNAVATSGIKFTNQQVRCIAKSFSRVAVCFDDEPQAIIQANKMVSELKFRGVDAFRVDIKGDPGGMDQNEADYLVKQLINRK